MNKTIFAAAFAATLCAGAPAFAGSVQSDAFATDVAQNIDVLTQSSELAAMQSPTEAVKIYAKSEMGVKPIEVAMNGITTVNEGRSAAVTFDMGTYEQPTVGVSFPTGAWSLPYLKSTDGKGFDWTYKAVQEDALTRLQGLYSAYSVSGDDPGLRAVAIAELPNVVARLNALHQL